MPPFVGVAVNVTEVPGQIVVAEAATLTAGTGTGNTFMVIPGAVTDTGFAQGALEVMMTVTTSLSAKVPELNAGLFVPAGFPFTCH